MLRAPSVLIMTMAIYFSDSVNSISCNCFSLLTFNFTFNGRVDNFYSTMPTAWMCLEMVPEKDYITIYGSVFKVQGTQLEHNN